MHCVLLTIHLHPVPAERRPDPHGLGRLQERHHHLVDGARSDNLGGEDEVGGGPPVAVLFSVVIFASFTGNLGAKCFNEL